MGGSLNRIITRRAIDIPYKTKRENSTKEYKSKNTNPELNNAEKTKAWP